MHTLELTTKQVNKLYGLTGYIRHEDEDFVEIRRQCSNIVGENDCYRGYSVSICMVLSDMGEEDD